jgi:protein farnesyltransferase subunit beta
MIDKPGKSPDLYHSCYALSGLSLAQNNMADHTVLGNQSNLLRKTDPVFNLVEGKAAVMCAYFKEKKTSFMK